MNAALEAAAAAGPSPCLALALPGTANSAAAGALAGAAQVSGSNSKGNSNSNLNFELLSCQRPAGEAQRRALEEAFDILVEDFGVSAQVCRTARLDREVGGGLLRLD